LIEVVFDTSKTGLEAVMAPWKVETLRYIWSKHGDAATTREIWEHIHPLHGISYKVIEKFLRRMTEEGILEKRSQVVRGRRQGMYSPLVGEEDFKVEVILAVLRKLLELSPKIVKQSIPE